MRTADHTEPAARELARQYPLQRRLAGRPLCRCCCRRIETDTYLVLKGVYYCQGCVELGTHATAEDFDPEGEE